MRWDRNSVREGMFVTSTKGERIGKVIRRDDGTFVVEKGTLFPKDYELRYDHITGIEGGDVTYSLADLFPREGRAERRPVIESPATTASLAAGAPAAAATAGAEASDNEVRIPLMQEELEIERCRASRGACGSTRASRPRSGTSPCQCAARRSSSST